MKLACNSIEATAAPQVRTKLHKDVIDQYREDLEAGAIFPPVIAFAHKGSEKIILSDGFHRLYATIHAGHEEIEVELHEGGMHEALVYALGANAGHGLRRSNADKVNAVKLALKDPEISQMTQQKIADICRVTRQTVNRISHRETLDENEQGGVTKLQRTEENLPDNIRPSGRAPTQQNDKGVTKSQEPEENKPENNRPTKTPRTQEMVDRDELRQAMSLIKAFPYGGDDTEKLGLSQDDIANVNYCIDWLTEVLKEHVRCQHQAKESQEQGIPIDSQEVA